MMTSRYRTHAEIAGALAVDSRGGVTAAGTDPKPITPYDAELARGRCYASHEPSIAAAGHGLRGIEQPPSGSRLECDDAAIGAGGVLGLVFAFAGGATGITFRARRAEVLERS